jgi:hypothetical protein
MEELRTTGGGKLEAQSAVRVLVTATQVNPGAVVTPVIHTADQLRKVPASFVRRRAESNLQTYTSAFAFAVTLKKVLDVTPTDTMSDAALTALASQQRIAAETTNRTAAFIKHEPTASELANVAVVPVVVTSKDLSDASQALARMLARTHAAGLRPSIEGPSLNHRPSAIRGPSAI